MRNPGSRISIRVYTAPATPPPDPLAESRQRRAHGLAAARALGPERSLRDMTERFTRGWPDPYGPDVTVFGPLDAQAIQEKWTT